MSEERDVLGLARADLRELAPYEPIDPVMVVAQRLGIPEADIVKLDGKRKSLRAVAGGPGGAGGVSLLSHIPRPRAAAAPAGAG